MNPVKQQYELYPYPPRNPQDEKRRLYALAIDHLALINHYCFRGSQRFAKGFRLLVAGGGTGDSVIYLADQLKETKAEIVYLDLSATSRAIAEERARIRGLRNIQWVTGSIGDLRGGKLGRFDYINCLGVLHHLENPLEGLAMLADALTPEGAIGIMVYGKYGRTGVTQFQQMMKLVHSAPEEPEAKVRHASAMLECLPTTNGFKRSEDFFSDHKKGKAGIFDLLLHEVDQPFSVPEVFEWVERAGLHFVEFCPNRCLYWPETLIRDGELLELVRSQPVRQRSAIAELLRGNLIRHEFYVSKRPDSKATLDQLHLVPFFLQGSERIRQFLGQDSGNRWEISLASGGSCVLNLSQRARKALLDIDGKKTLAQLEIPPDFAEIYETLNALNYLVLRAP